MTQNPFEALGGGGFDSLDPIGVAFALGAGAMWAAYIVFSARTGRRFPQADGLADMSRIGQAFAESGIPVDDLGLKRPSLDDVFLALTGHRAEHSLGDDGDSVDGSDLEGALR